MPELCGTTKFWRDSFVPERDSFVCVGSMHNLILRVPWRLGILGALAANSLRIDWQEEVGVSEGI
jgi:hypothetical protein